MFHRLVVKSIIKLKINPVIRVLIASDFIFWSSYQLMAPVFAIFVTNQVNGSIETVGISTAIYFVVKSIFEIPVGIIIDRTVSEKDDIYMAIVGIVLVALTYFFYSLATQVFHIYLLQGLMGLASAMIFPSWISMFTRHIDRGREGFEWSIYDVFTGLGMAASAALGGFVADVYGFRVLFSVAACTTLSGAMLLFFVRNRVYMSQVTRD